MVAIRPESRGGRAGALDPTGLRFALFCTVAAFSTYFCMYAFRKPFAVAKYEGYALFGVDYKILAVIFQTIGYAASKFGGIKVVPEISPGRRIRMLVILIGVAEVALFFFALVPAPYNIVFLIAQGFPLGMVWGIVFSFLEGRRFTEMLGAGLCCSFILASGAVKSVGSWLMESHGVGEFWMPAITGVLFVPPLAGALWMLSRVPPPTEEDRHARTARVVMEGAARRDFFARHAAGISALVAAYVLLNVYRDFRDLFAPELWGALGYEGASSIFTLSEIPISVAVLVMAALLALIRNNRTAARVSLATVPFGAVLILLSTIGFREGWVDGAIWMVLVGLGMYLPYIAFHVAIYERLIALWGRPANIAFLMYLSDAFGYLGSVSILLYRNFGAADLSWLDFFVSASFWVSGGLGVTYLIAWVVLRRHANDGLGEAMG